MTLPSPEEAREMLADIDLVAKRMRNTCAASSLAPNLMIWGVVWAIGFISTFFWPNRALQIWGTVCVLGLLASLALGISRRRQQLVLCKTDKQLGLKLLALWLADFAYATLMVFALKPHYGPDFVTIFVLFAMLAYIVMGLWFNSLPLALIGIFVSAITVFGRLAFSEPHFLLWMAIFGSGGLFVPGVYILWRWR